MRSRSNIRPAKPPAAASTGAVIDLTEDSDNTDDNELDEIEDDLMVFD